MIAITVYYIDKNRHKRFRLETKRKEIPNSLVTDYLPKNQFLSDFWIIIDIKKRKRLLFKHQVQSFISSGDKDHNFKIRCKNPDKIQD
ncbi:hypothetical protein B5C26_01810 [Photorhabdus luminescens]|uniref:Uncharacterized protein n=1 Tax=Photorhabdus luminescens subsp. mexicana TaxID=2100167 RepID=A0A4R4JPV8_PHOLU|nr:hypothetical protein B5C26_01810 [Photorhabdus luminescens]TDB55691.1 hypothetical protein C5468_03460 [Photorhabdus luminescens subsp. mexicana]